MGFYGNITNTSKTNFVFDKIYTNRKAMDTNLNKDGIFIGRYVLVEYGEITEDSFIRAYGPQEDGYYHIANNNDTTTRILYTTEQNPSEDNYIKKGQIIYVLGIGGKYEFLECNGGVNKGKPTFAENPGLDPQTDPYFYNLKQDQAEYNVSRGYDGTVWVKTSVNNEIKYVNIAELNSVVPSFEMVADAPTMSPILPHFDTASNNVYYKLHWQPAWGMRIAEAEEKDGKIYSDYKTSWSQEYYNKETGQTYVKWYNPVTEKWDSDSPCEIAADIYFNYAAFDPQVGKSNISGKVEEIDDYIGVTVDGLSGNEYNLHDGTSATQSQIDTQQIHINLPAIGNMMSEAWDIIHGKKRDDIRTDEDGGSLQGRLDSFEAFYKNQIPVKNQNGTVIGSKINGAQSYTSWEGKPTDILYDNTTPKFERDDAWIETKINTEGLKTGDKNTANDQINNSGISIHHTFHATQDTVATLDKNTGDQTLKHIDQTTVNSNKKGKIPILNKYSDKNETGKEDTLKLYSPYVDAKGHVVGKNIETITLPYGYKKIEAKNSTSKNNATDTVVDIPTADNTQDTLKLEASNKWIKLSTTDSAEENKVTFGHKHSDFVTGTSANTLYGLTQNEDHTSNLNIDNKFEVPCLQFDEAGHIIEARTHTVTLPELFKKVIIGGSSSETDNTTHVTGSLEADTMTDEFTINPGNKWIQMTVDEGNDAFSIQHYVNKFTEGTGAINYNTATTKTFNIQNIGWDEAGHLTSSKKTTYTLPDGFKTIAIANNGSSDADTFGTGTTNINLVAETLTDTATIDTGNRWLTLVANTDEDKVTLYHAAAGTTSTSKNLQTKNNTSPNFGASFKVLTAGIDQAGHVKDLEDYSITLPKSSLAEGAKTTTGATSASVVTGIVLENADIGKFTKTTANIGTLTLEGYKLGTDAGTLEDSDTINDAMSKLQKQISNEITNRENAIKALDVTAITTGTDKVFNSISETDGKVSASTQAVSNLTLSNYSIPSSYTGIKNGNTLNAAFGQLEKGLAEEKVRAQEEEKKLSDRITAIIGGVTEAELNTLKEISDALQDDENYYATVNNAIAEVQNSLEETNNNVTNNYVLKSTYDTLLARVIALEEKLETPAEDTTV